MQRYVVEKEIGEGAFGTVFRARRLSDRTEVAMKRMKRRFPEWNEGVALREIKCLMKLMKKQRHRNIVEIYEVIRTSDHSLFLVFECMQETLLEFMQRYALRKDLDPIWQFAEPEIRRMIRQILQGLEHLHKQGYVHRDIKPENILIRGDVCKVADFGLARELPTHSNQKPCTDYVTTRWYRAPEVCLRAPRHDPPVDMFAVGCVMAELYNLYPLFPGKTELDQIHLITKVLGAPNKYSWPEGVKLAARIQITFSPQTPTPLSNEIRSASPVGLALLGRLLVLNPQRRITATAALAHKFFETSQQGAPPPLTTCTNRHHLVSASPHVKHDTSRAVASDSDSSSRPSKVVAGSKRPCMDSANIAGDIVEDNKSPHTVVNPYRSNQRQKRHNVHEQSE